MRSAKRADGPHSLESRQLAPSLSRRFGKRWELISLRRLESANDTHPRAPGPQEFEENILCIAYLSEEHKRKAAAAAAPQD